MRRLAKLRLSWCTRRRYVFLSAGRAVATMTRGKPVQAGVRVKLPSGLSWQQLGELSPAEIRRRGLWPKGFLPLPHPFHDQGGMVFPDEHIAEVKRQEGRDPTRFDLAFAGAPSRAGASPASTATRTDTRTRRRTSRPTSAPSPSGRASTRRASGA